VRTRPGRWSLAASLTLALALTGATAAAGSRDPKPTTITVDAASVTDDGAVDVIGSISSPARICRTFRTVELILKRPGGRTRHLDVGMASFQSQAWRLKTKAGVADDGTFYVQVERQRIIIVSVGEDGEEKRRRVVCAGDRAPVELPAPQ
jgi:hypothetical protein